MRRFLVACSVSISLAAGTVTAEAGWHEFWHSVKVDFHRNNAWPEPFQSADRAATRAPFLTQTDNGWKMQNTVGTFLFDEATGELNQAGKLKVKWIVTQAPLHRRAVFVFKADKPEINQQRMESVQTYISSLIPEGDLPPVYFTNTEPDGGSGEYFDAINRAVQDSIPSPRLPPPANGAGGSTGGEGG
ncbi:hypothetical protein Psta_2171 [Pirellula staleyi DSM 6068]|uniref:Uncharacterized protein n=1 Tax=Pirellula staleyi (strain ATCC 27377 / DSM 6068 / ICPB 4128) TaxID=530564 RepID=D2R2K4_PIRSD|nr:hypothetical protein [Pirellula staleyi]ADB16844.1 hypothetical protein Psta_2171 [Pirellula staleyi DSM 6068]